MATNGNSRGGADAVLIAALASGRSYQEAAEAAGCSKSTVARRMATDGFRADVSAAREEYIEMLRGRLLQAQPTAVSVLAEIMTRARSDADRILAARALLDVRTRDPLLDEQEVHRVVRLLIDLAMRHVPDDRQGAFVAEVRALLR